MDFCQILIALSENDSFERMVFEKMKPYLITIAGDGHPKGCHVIFQNFFEQELDVLGKIMEEEEIVFSYPNSIYLEEKYIVWNSSGSKDIGGGTHFIDLSDKLIRIKKDNNNAISISIEIIGKDRLYDLKLRHSYISRA